MSNLQFLLIVYYSYACIRLSIYLFYNVNISGILRSTRFFSSNSDSHRMLILIRCLYIWSAMVVCQTKYNGFSAESEVTRHASTFGWLEMTKSNTLTISTPWVTLFPKTYKTTSFNVGIF